MCVRRKTLFRYHIITNRGEIQIKIMHLPMFGQNSKKEGGIYEFNAD